MVCLKVMQDSLGGNAKTLMFVNVSPADYNQEETVTALTYATRVKLITNSAEKQQVRDLISPGQVPPKRAHGRKMAMDGLSAPCAISQTTSLPSTVDNVSCFS